MSLSFYLITLLLLLDWCSPFHIDEEVVTNAQFARFVIETEYVTEAEKFGWSFVFQGTASPMVARECDQNMGRVKYVIRLQ